ncbi:MULTISPECIES: aminodeoxychorismate lyase [Gammaproteobacteria]|uniref:aminodeoxychorismate lyase n=1 Tax=Gammaproteobacteria TaxID=1236 RepID=UPI000DD0222C|nr:MULTISPECIES: aminodeoxychorismate lyase [Gammaproteobacteria]RTE87278.1 aminodeoxychorismate lyase [Aliidiomarina sp. B3213]TCZ92935.1 aminodeoxychorismate lyase [Lysobacter sp. N42]
MDSDKISIKDRGFLYGDGFFTTLRISNRAPSFWLLHWQRITECCSVLGIDTPSEEYILRCLKHEAEENDMPCDCGARITITRGEGGRGYQVPLEQHVNVIISVFPIPEDYAEFKKQGMNVGVAERRLGTVMPELRGLKTLNRLEQVMLKMELGDKPCFNDLIVLDTDQKVVEATAGNVFCRWGTNWRTPSLRNSGIRGVIREHILSQRPDFECVEFNLDDLQQADEIVITNSLLEVVSVRTLNANNLNGFTQRSLYDLGSW